MTATGARSAAGDAPRTPTSSRSWTPVQESDDSLIERATAHDRAAFTTLYDRYVDRVYRHVRYRLSDRTEAEDVTQEVFVRAWKAIPR